MSNVWIKQFDEKDKESAKDPVKIGLQYWLEMLYFLRLPDQNELEELREHIREKYPMRCPPVGTSFTAWKKALTNRGPDQELIVELEVPEDALRTNNGIDKKCRCSKAVVKDITNIDGSRHYKNAVSSHDWNFMYKVGETVVADWFDENPFMTCGHGIHFYMTREEAVEHKMLKVFFQQDERVRTGKGVLRG